MRVAQQSAHMRVMRRDNHLETCVDQGRKDNVDERVAVLIVASLDRVVEDDKGDSLKDCSREKRCEPQGVELRIASIMRSPRASSRRSRRS